MKLFALPILLLLAACAPYPTSHGAPFKIHVSVPENQAIAYFFQIETLEANSCLLVSVDGERRGCIGYPGFAQVDIAAGNHKISFTPNTLIKIANMKFDFSFEKGKVYYFEYRKLSTSTERDQAIKYHYLMLDGAHYGWVLVDEDMALKKLGTLQEWQ